MTKKKLLIVMPTLSRGGGERVVSELSRVFARHLEVVIVVFEVQPSYSYQARVVDMNIPLSPRFFDRAFLFFKRLWHLKNMIAQEKPDWVMSLGASTGIMCLLAAKRPIIRIDMFISAERNGFFGFVFRLALKFLLRRAGLVVPVSRAIAQDVEERYGASPKKTRVIYNPTDVAVIRELATKPMAPECRAIFEKPVIATMGRLAPQKAHWHLLRAFSRVCQQVPEAHLVFLGEGELRNRLEALASELGIADKVHFLGWQKNPFCYLARSKLFALSSLWEGLPDVLLEALACGTPIVSADCRSGPREILDPSTDPFATAKTIEHAEYGILVPVCDGKWRGATQPLAPEETMMAEALTSVLQNENLREQLVEKAVQRARDFDIQTIAPQWKFLWEKAGF